MALICGFAAIFGAAGPAGADANPPCSASATATCAASLAMTAGTWMVQGGTPPNDFPAATQPGLTGSYNPTTGSLTGGTLTIPPDDNVCTDQGCTNFSFYEAHPGSAALTIDSQGNATLSDALTVEVDVTSPISQQCVSTTPANVIFSSTSPYGPSVGTMDLDTGSFSIPDFGTANCGAAAGSLNAYPGGVAGPGADLTLDLSGTLPLPAPPTNPSTTTLTVTPDSPQLTGTAVTLNATVAPQAGTGPTPTGTVTFEANGVALAAQALADDGTASFTSATLPSATNTLTAVYSGDGNYGTSASATVPYVIQPLPSITSNLPSSMTVGAAPMPFTLTVNNPTGGADWSDLYLEVSLSRLSQTSSSNRPVISYEDDGGNRCPLAYASTSNATPYAFYSGAGTPPCGTPAMSVSLGAGATLSIPMEIAYPAAAKGGTQNLTVTVYSGTCTTPTSCTAVAPLTGSAAPSASATFQVLPTGGPYTPTVTITSSPPANTARGLPIRTLPIQVKAPESSLPFPSGTATVLMDGAPVATATLTNGRGTVTNVSTADLATGSHTVVVQYDGDNAFTTAQSAPYAFTVTPPSPGVAFTCALSIGGTTTQYAATVVATGLVAPITASAGSTVSVSNLSVALYLAQSLWGSAGTSNAPSTVGIAPNGTISAPGITFAANDTTDGYQVGEYSGLSTTVTTDGNPGDTVPIAVNELHFTKGSGALGSTYDCTPADPDQPATIGSVTLTGNVLSASPEGSAPTGASVTLDDTVSPTPTGAATAGQVELYDGTTDLGTASVAYQGLDAGIASLTVNSLSVGDHQFSAVWSGNLSVPANTSNTVDYVVGTDTTTSLTSSSNPANAASPVTFTATVNPPDGAPTTPTGDVSFTQDGNPIASCQNVALSMDYPPVANCSVTMGAGQSHAIVATYSGDASYIGSVSDALTQTTLPGTNTTILSTKDPSPPGNVTFWSGVSPSSGSGAVPTGTVAFTIDGSVYKACKAQPLGPGGGASCTVSFKAGTTHRVYATYPGSASYSGSKSSTITQSVAGAKSSTVPKATGGSATLASGKSLTAGQSLTAGAYRLAMQTDGNLVEYQGTKALWASGTAGHPGAGVTMQTDGNLVEYQGGHAIWASKTAGHAGAHLTLQGSDGNVVIYQGTTALWATGT